MGNFLCEKGDFQNFLEKLLQKCKINRLFSGEAGLIFFLFINLQIFTNILTNHFSFPPTTLYTVNSCAHVKTRIYSLYVSTMARRIQSVADHIYSLYVSTMARRIQSVADHIYSLYVSTMARRKQSVADHIFLFLTGWS